jgi:hypothetical protein
MDLVHSSNSPFEKPKRGEKYSGMEYSFVSISDFQSNYSDLFEDEPDSSLFGVAIDSAGMGGASLIRRRVIPWDEYLKLDDDLREVAVSSTETLIEPPGRWRLAVQSALVSYLYPESHEVGTLLQKYDDVLWEIPEYHKVEEDARYPKNIPDEKFDELEEKVSVKEPRSGKLYLSDGQARVYSTTTISSSKSCTEFNISNIRPVSVNPEDTYVLPFSEQQKMSDKEIDELSLSDNVWFQTRPSHSIDRRVQIFFDTLMKPESVTARLGRIQEWMNFGISMEESTYTSELRGSELLPESVIEDLEDAETSLRDELDDKILEYQNKSMDKLRSFCRRKNI